MLASLSTLVLGATAVSAAVVARHKTQQAPTVTVKNGSYYGVNLPHYSQDLFLGLPYAQPPVGELRFRVPQSLNSSWTGSKNATEYGPQCIGYGSDNWVLGNIVSEDCLTINVVRPSNVQEGDDLPVAFWIHGGGYTEGGGRDPRYNLTFIVQQSVKVGSPMVAVSINYRLAQWGFMYSQQLADEGSSNLGLRDQRLAMHWVQDNIGAFGGDPAKVTIWGESAGGNSIGNQLVAYGGRDDGLFRAAISQSGAPTSLMRYPTPGSWKDAYEAYVNASGCGTAADSLACLRTVPSDKLSALFNSSTITVPSEGPVVDGDFLTQSGTTALRNGHFVKVPYLIGANFDEGGSFGSKGINTTDQFIGMVLDEGIDNTTALTLAALYPDIPAVGIPATLHGRPPASELATYGSQWKRSAAYKGDHLMHVGRRLTSELWTQHNGTLWSYHFNVLVHGLNPLVGAAHFQDVVFVFDNTQGLGYENAVSVNPFKDEPATFVRLAQTMSRTWVSFITKLDPNALQTSPVHWPQYSLDSPQNMVFDVNATDVAYIEPDTYRAEGIAYIGSIFDTVYGR
ncbi:carboxylesterase family protein [Grosmannia clavigera kw1407]|uniref:Carboxylic ester hydrolase n=1 Tax=Grosmannia clavigera (strain kw1407 / UAMH 11150) TaxID=655863 RepID=F0XKP2_GROCL|nr:carboxylesterase family protein [Grosmannia clavigera kw1407]EFX01808.1 carboxylesterase family protein [Grosmannia clavigera kw1407]